MQEIRGLDYTIENLLLKGGYGIDYYQREYKWGAKQMEELVNDLTDRFFDFYTIGDIPKDIDNYGQYFLGSILISKQDGNRYIVDGQQRITSLTLILIYLNNLQKALGLQIDIEKLIYADYREEKQFKLSVPERNDCMKALLETGEYSAHEASESVQNLVARYHDLENLFPSEMDEQALKVFIYWFKENVKLIEIIADAEEDAYRIFETMNDRGLSLSPTDMLKGYLLAGITDPEQRKVADQQIKNALLKFSEFGKDTDADFLKVWLRARYAQTIRERKKGATPEDFDKIGTEYHRWVRSNADIIGLTSAENFNQWIQRDLVFYADIYTTLLDAAKTRTQGLESVKYNADNGFTQQYLLLLSAITPEDDTETALKKAGIVADFVDCWINRRVWNMRSIAYSTMQYAVFILCKELRNKDISELGTFLTERLALIEQDIQSKLSDDMITTLEDASFARPTLLNQFSTKYIHRQLARFTDWLETQSDQPGLYDNYIIRSGRNAFEVEHIWADHFDRHTDEFDQQGDFQKTRNMIGDLILLPKKVNASLNDMTYSEKQPHYIKENILAQSLHEDEYINTPGFLQTIERHNLPFKPHPEFNKADIEARNALYCQLASIIWSSERLQTREAG